MIMEAILLHLHPYKQFHSTNDLSGFFDVRTMLEYLLVLRSFLSFLMFHSIGGNLARRVHSDSDMQPM